MATETTTLPVKFHISLNVADLERSVAFYRVLFACEPAKRRADYAKFESDDPPLVLSLEPNQRAAGGALNHLGLRVGDAPALVEIQRRFEAAGISTQREEGVECCYALQTKFWVTDPDRNLWELYVLHEDLDHRGIGQTQEAVLPAAGSLSPSQAPPPVAWEHTLGTPIPERLPEPDASVDEVILAGSFNAALPSGDAERLLAEAHRILRPGGQLLLHMLVADRAFPQGLPQLPGPAAVVQAVPLVGDVLKLVEQAGYVQLHLEKFAATPCFVHDGVQMRELKLRAIRPTSSTTGPAQFVVYRGPLKQVTDDAGNIYPRGQRVPIDSAALAALRASPAAEQFVVMAGETLVTLGGR